MPTHRYSETYRGPVAFGLSRDVDEATLTIYLQKLSDDTLMETLRSRLTDGEIEEIADLIGRILKKHLTHDEYHRLFLGQAPKGRP